MVENVLERKILRIGVSRAARTKKNDSKRNIKKKFKFFIFFIAKQKKFTIIYA